MNNNQKKGIAFIIGGILSFIILPYFFNFIFRLIGSYMVYRFMYNYHIIPPLYYIIALVLIGFGIKHLLVNKNEIDDDETNNETINKKNEMVNQGNPTINTINSDQTNKVTKITIMGGLIGLFAGSPVASLNKKIKIENSQGWEVVQVLPDTNMNLLIVFIRIVLLLLTFLLYTTANGYYIVLKKSK